MCSKVKRFLILYLYILLALFFPSLCLKLLSENAEANVSENLPEQIKRFRKTYLEALIVTLTTIFIAYIFAGFPKIISWNKLIPTLLIAFPVYESRNAGLATWGGESIGERMDKLFFKTVYVIGVTWLAWDIFKGII